MFSGCFRSLFHSIFLFVDDVWFCVDKAKSLLSKSDSNYNNMKQNPENIKLIAELEPDFMGFIFYKNSKRYIGKYDIPTINKNIKKVGVFVDPKIEYINKMVNKY